MKAYFHANEVEFVRYPIRPATIYPSGRIAYSEIGDADPLAAPPEIRTLQGETLFVSAEQADEFRAAIAEIGIPIVRRIDVWDLLLEPFLDTEFSEQAQQQTLATLEHVGVPLDSASRIRRSVRSAMLQYNFFLWEWVHLGLFDVLLAVQNGVSWKSMRHRLIPGAYRAFYWQAMEFAERGRIAVPDQSKALPERRT